MAPLPSNNTGVLYVDYSVAGEDHTMQVRWSSTSSPVDAMNVLDEFLTELPTSLRLITITGARTREAGANITLPITWIGAPTYGSGAADHVQSAWYLDFIGRSTGGRRVRLSVFGSAQIADLAESDYRLPATGEVGAAQQVLVNNTDVIVAIDDLPPVWYDYANIGVNAYWRNRIR